MRPGNLDLFLLVAIFVLAGFEGVVLGAAAISAADPMSVLRDGQPLILATLAAFGATLAFRSAMAKVWIDRDMKKMEQDGVAESLSQQMLVQAYMTTDIYYRVSRSSHVLIANAQLRRRINNEILDIVKANDEVTKAYRDNLRHVAPSRMVEVLDKHVGFSALTGDLRMILEFFAEWEPNPDEIRQEIAGIHYFLTLIGQKLVNLTFKYSEGVWEKWKAELNQALEERDQLQKKWWTPDGMPRYHEDDPNEQ